MKTSEETRNSIGPMLNAYPDSIGHNLSGAVDLLKDENLKNVFESFYILPSIYNSDLDRGFSVIDYNLNKELATPKDLEDLRKYNINLKLDFILNHASVLSSQFQDLIKNGEKSEYADFFINWNKFWEGYGTETPQGYIQPEEKYIKDMFFRKKGLPILMVRMPDGKDIPYWNTFYQEIIYPHPDALTLMEITDIQYLQAVKLSKLIDRALSSGVIPREIDYAQYKEYQDAITEYLENNRKYLGQMDLNIKSELVWEHYRKTLKLLSDYGARIVRLDAFAYAPKTPGMKNFLNEPDTWDVLERVKTIADSHNLTLLPEIHATYNEGIYEKVARKGYMTYDFFLPGLLIHAIEKHSPSILVKWANEILDKNICTVNMLGCHDGIPLLDLKGLLSEEDIKWLIELIVSRGGYVKDLHGQKNMYYQVNATYYSALGENDKKMLLARAVQLFMPGKPQIWYLDLFMGKNDLDAVRSAGNGGHKEINRTNLSRTEINSALNNPSVKEQLRLLKIRNNHPAFNSHSKISIKDNTDEIYFKWEYEEHFAVLSANLKDYSYKIQLSTF
ncbi:MAG: glycosidase [Lachnospiraceae bacterium]|nr:glycosidase [Lachnospiraceae bacterium]